jgi:hypothetical protein
MSVLSPLEVLQAKYNALEIKYLDLESQLKSVLSSTFEGQSELFDLRSKLETIFNVIVDDEDIDDEDTESCDGECNKCDINDALNTPYADEFFDDAKQKDTDPETKPHAVPSVNDVLGMIQATIAQINKNGGRV